MGLFDQLGSSYVTLDSTTVKKLSQSSDEFKTVEVQPPEHEKLSSTLNRFVKAITEYQTRLFSIRNTSPVVAYEIHRFTPEKLRL